MNSTHNKVRAVLEREYPHMVSKRRAEVEALVTDAVTCLSGGESEADRHRILFSLASHAQASPSQTHGGTHES